MLLAAFLFAALVTMGGRKGAKLRELAKTRKALKGVPLQPYSAVKEELVRRRAAGAEYIQALAIAITMLPGHWLPPHIELADEDQREASAAAAAAAARLPACLAACACSRLPGSCTLPFLTAQFSPQKYDVWACGAPVFIVDGRAAGGQRLDSNNQPNPAGNRMDVPPGAQTSMLDISDFPCTVVDKQRIEKGGGTTGSYVVMAYAPGWHLSDGTSTGVPAGVMGAIKMAHTTLACWSPAVARDVGPEAGMSGFRISNNDAKATNPNQTTPVGRWVTGGFLSITSGSAGSAGSAGSGSAGSEAQQAQQHRSNSRHRNSSTAAQQLQQAHQIDSSATAATAGSSDRQLIRY